MIAAGFYLAWPPALGFERGTGCIFFGHSVAQCLGSYIDLPPVFAFHLV